MTTPLPRRLAALADRWEAMPGHLRGVALCLAAGSVFTIMNWMIKTAGTTLPAAEVGFFRALIGLLFTLPLALAVMGWNAFRTPHMGRHALRGALGAASMVLSFYAMIHLPLAEATAYNFSKSLFVVPLAAFFLGERLNPGRIAAVLVGFGGVLVMLRPDTGFAGGMSPAAGAALAAAFLIGFIVVLVKQLMRTEAPTTVLLYFGVFMTLFSAIPAAFVWRMPVGHEWTVLIAIGALGTAAQSLIIRAYRAADATMLAPIEYIQLVFAAAIGFTMFGDIPTWASVAGAGLIVASGLWLTWRERNRPPANSKPKV